MMSPIRLGHTWLSVVATALVCAGPAWGQLRLLSEQELSATRGQGLLALSNTSYNGFDFTRISLGADVNLNANFKNISLGNYNRNDPGGIAYARTTDIDIPLLQFGRSDLADKRLVQITNPYIEFVYRNVADAATREVVGMRLGFEGIAGDVGLNLKTLSGSMLVDGVDTTGVRVGGPAIVGVTAGNAAGASNDFWISALKTTVQFQGTAAAQAAQAGMWLNWRDKLTAIATSNGLPPPNLGH
jgi:hypothetical protein